MDYDAIRAGLQTAIPYNVHLGLEVAEVAPGRGVVRLPDRAEIRNHVGSQHAGALFSAGEAASGAAFVGTFAGRLGDLVPLAEGADIAYRKLAQGTITATAQLEEADELIAALDEDGVVRFPVGVQLSNAVGDTVAEMTVHWHVRVNAAS
jgi:acyl-coenzyme A thioesterase PaaI-like protein